ncbi:MAG: AtpZ/AtpI family protein [Parachlamydiaceae bacterium]
MDDDQGKGRLFAFALVLPFVILAPPLAGWWLGSYLDEVWKTKPLFLYLFLALGVAAGAKEAFRIVKSIKDELDDR